MNASSNTPESPLDGGDPPRIDEVFGADVFSRRVVGWSIATTPRAELVTAALRMALHRRQRTEVVVNDSDQGCQGEFRWSAQRSG